MTAKRFHLGDVLSLTTWRLLCPDGVAGLYRIAKHMTGEDIYTHQLPRVFKECREPLKRQFPQIAHLGGEDITQDNYKEWLADKVAQFGEWFDVQPLSDGEHRSVDPITEAFQMMAEKSNETDD